MSRLKKKQRQTVQVSVELRLFKRKSNFQICKDIVTIYTPQTSQHAKASEQNTSSLIMNNVVSFLKPHSESAHPIHHASATLRVQILEKLLALSSAN
jgi:hypothetical protein